MSLVALVFMAVTAGSPCSRIDWDLHPKECLERSRLTAEFSYFSRKVAEFSGKAAVPVPVIRPTVLLVRIRSAEVERLGDGHHEIRVDAEDLVRPRRVLRYVAAHEVCHIVNGDTEHGVWAQLTRERRDEMHRWVEACAFDLLGAEAYGEYLNIICGSDLVRHLSVLQSVRRDAEMWHVMRRQAHASVP